MKKKSKRKIMFLRLKMSKKRKWDIFVHFGAKSAFLTLKNLQVPNFSAKATIKLDLSIKMQFSHFYKNEFESEKKVKFLRNRLEFGPQIYRFLLY